MSKSKNEQQGETTKKADKTVERLVRSFTFPKHGITIKADSLKEAQNKLIETLKSKTKDHD